MAGRPSHRKVLAVWMNGERVGRWELTPGAHRFCYDEAWLANPLSRPLSLSLPLARGTEAFTGDVVESWFDNLLPDSIDIRKRVARRFGAASTRAFELLECIGRDCVGAVQLLPDDAPAPKVDTIAAEPLSDAAVEHMLDQTVQGVPWGVEDDALRISIAGAQEKTALLWHKGRWCRPLGATPTTHILKLPMGEVGGMRADFSTSVENEWLCAKIAHAFGFPVADCEIAIFGRYKVLVVTRFDRRLVGESWWARLPQEDFCQALGFPGELRYEDKGGPGMADILGILRASDTAAQDRQRFLAAHVLFWLLAAPDGHAKNFSIFLLPGGRLRLTPLYDILSAWPIVGNGPRQIPWKKLRMAMAVVSRNRHYRMADIQRRHWHSLARANALGPEFDTVLEGFAQQASTVVKTVSATLPPDFPKAVSEQILAGLLEQAARLG